MNRDVVVVSKGVLDDMVAMKKAGFSKTEIRAREGNGYKLARLDELVFHEASGKNRKQNEKEFKAQLQSMAENGQQEPVKVYRGKFIVDGRHRYWALKDLGVEYIKYVDLPYDATLDDLESVAEATEVRRSDTPAQKAAKAYMDYMENSKAEEQKSRYYATKHGTSHGSISKMSKIADKLGTDVVSTLYNIGEVFIAGKRYNSLSPLYQLALSINHNPPKSDDVLSDIPRDVLEVFRLIDGFKKRDELTKIVAIKTYCQRAITILNED